MRFGLVHRIMTNALAALGVLALVSSGELGRWVNIAIVVGLALALMVPEAWHQRPWLNRLATAGPVALLALQIGRWFTGRPLLELAVEFAAALQIVRLATRRGAAHDQQVIVLALLHLIAGTVLGGGLGYGLCFVGFLVVAPAALVLSHLRREVEGNYRQGARDRTGLPVDVPRILRSRRVVGQRFLLVTCSLAVPILVFTTALFILFPRVGLQFLLMSRPHGGRMVGFSDHVDLGGVGLLRDDPQIALRLSITDLPEPPPERVTLHLRGTALDAYDGRAWTRTSTQRTVVGAMKQVIPFERWPDAAKDRLVTVELESFEPPVLFVPPGAVAMEVIARTDSSFLPPTGLRVERGPEGEFRYRNSEERGVRYQIWLSRTPLVHAAPLPRDELPRYLALPPLPRRIADLAHEWTQGASTPMEKARAIETKLRTEYRYDLASPSGATAQPLDDFLFVSRRGHCEFYSTAMAVLLRYTGVPTRNVTGFVGGSYNRFSRNYIVRQGDAHSWVEAWIDGIGWTTFDPTPPADAAPKSELRGFLALVRDIIEASSKRWDRDVVGYDIHQQISLLERFRGLVRNVPMSTPFGAIPRRGLVAVVSLVLLAGAIIVVQRRFRRRAPVRRPAGSPREQAALLATALYEMLDGAMAAQGVGRAQGIPPLRHATDPAVQSHPLASEIMALTSIYIDARFGGVGLDEDAQRDFERRVKALRGFRAKA